MPVKWTRHADVHCLKSIFRILFLPHRLCFLLSNQRICWKWLFYVVLICDVQWIVVSRRAANQDFQVCTLGFGWAPTGAQRQNLVCYSLMQRRLWNPLESTKYPGRFLVVKWRSWWLYLLSLSYHCWEKHKLEVRSFFNEGATYWLSLRNRLYLSGYILYAPIPLCKGKAVRF